MTQTTSRDTQRGSGKLDKKPEISKRERAILVAERLFAREGYHGVSMRDIAKEAEIGLPIIVYHFETKFGLYKSIFEYRKGLIEERLARLEQITDFDQPDILLKIAMAWVSPIVMSYATAEVRDYAQLIAREASDPQEATHGIVEEYYDPLAKACISALRRALPKASEEYLCWSYLFAAGALIMVTCDHRFGRISENKFEESDVETKTKMLAAFISNGIGGGADKFNNLQSMN
jgi:AcrR family transcriptional regulator